MPSVVKTVPMTVRFIHTADWQIGMKASGVGPAGLQVREARLNTIDRILGVAKERGINLLLITGDVFEDNAVDRFLVRKVGDKLSRFPGRVYIIPGNHDPLVPGSVWEHAVWEEASNVSVIREPEPIELDDCILFPCPLKEKCSNRNPTSWIGAGEFEKIAIGLAHGNVEGLPDAAPDFPIPRDAPGRTGLDFLAVGHWHSFATYPGADGAVRLAYSGTHETTKFGERDSGNVLVVEIYERGAAPKLESVPVGRLQWKTEETNLDREGALDSVLTGLNEIPSPESTLLRLRLNGLLYASDRAKLASVEEVISTRFLYGIVDGQSLVPAPEDDSWIESLPVGPVRQTAEKLRAQAVDSSNEEEKAIATQALIMLFELNGRMDEF